MSTVPPISAEPPRGSLVVGGANGIGRAIARSLADRGDEVVVADIDGAAAAACADELRAAGGSARAVELDVTDVEASPRGGGRRSTPRCRSRPLSPTPASRSPGPWSTSSRPSTTASWRSTFAACSSSSRPAIRAMAPRGSGSIITVCSTSGFTASTGPMTVYDASKGAVRLLTQAAAREVAASGIRVNAVAPGTVETGLTLGLASQRGARRTRRERGFRSAVSADPRRSRRPSRSSRRRRRPTSPGTCSSSMVAGSPEPSLTRRDRGLLDTAFVGVHDAHIPAAMRTNTPNPTVEPRA